MNDRERLSRCGVTLQVLAERLLADRKLSVHSVTHRIKSEESMVAKRKRKGGRPLTDVIGLRIITYFQDDVAAVASMINEEFDVDEANSLDKGTILDPDRFGYLSVHYVAQFKASRLELREYAEFYSQAFEFQVRSILQHAWAEIEHDLGYKAVAEVPRDVRRRFSRLAGLLELGDEEFSALRRDLVEHRRVVESSVASGRGDVSLDRDTIFAWVASSDRLEAIEVALVGAVSGSIVGGAVRDEAGLNAASLSKLGFATIDDVASYLDKYGADIVRFGENWLRGDFEGGERDDDVFGTYEAHKGVGLQYLLFHACAALAVEGKQSMALAALEVGGFEQQSEILMHDLVSCLGSIQSN